MIEGYSYSPGKPISSAVHGGAPDWQAPDRVVPGVVRELQYEVREGGEAGEVVVLPKAFIAICNGSFILQVQLIPVGGER